MTYGKSQTNGLEVLGDYGEFNLGRLWIGALYYLTEDSAAVEDGTTICRVPARPL
jgi:hypothetical protein